MKLRRVGTPLGWAIVTAVTLLLVQGFSWNVLDLLTPLLGLPLIGLVWLTSLLVAALLLILGVRRWRQGPGEALPVLVLVPAILVAWFAPLTNLWIEANFKLKRQDRERVVALIHEGQLRPNVAHNASLIALPSDSGLSTGGNEVVVERGRAGKFVFFFTFRGILDHYSGFLWVPEGSEAQQFTWAADSGTQIIRFADNWYFIGHR